MVEENTKLCTVIGGSDGVNTGQFDWNYGDFQYRYVEPRPMEWEDFIMAFFHGSGFHIPVLEVTIIPVKQAGIDLLDPILTAQKNWTDNVLSQDTWWNLCGGGFSYSSGNTPYC